MNILFNAKKRAGIITVTDQKITFGPIAITDLGLPKAKFISAFTKKIYAVSSCGNSMSMCSCPTNLVCVGEMIHLKQGVINSQMSVRFNDVSFLVGMVDILYDGQVEEASIEHTMNLLAKNSILATKNRCTEKKFTPEDGWFFVDGGGLDDLATQSIDYINKRLTQDGEPPYKKALIRSLRLLSGRNNDLSVDANDALLAVVKLHTKESS